MASNQVEAHRRAQSAVDAAIKAGADDKTIGKLEAEAAAAKANTPGGKGGSWGILS